MVEERGVDARCRAEEELNLRHKGRPALPRRVVHEERIQVADGGRGQPAGSGLVEVEEDVCACVHVHVRARVCVRVCVCVRVRACVCSSLLAPSLPSLRSQAMCASARTCVVTALWVQQTAAGACAIQEGSALYSCSGPQL